MPDARIFSLPTMLYSLPKPSIMILLLKFTIFPEHTFSLANYTKYLVKSASTNFTLSNNRLNPLPNNKLLNSSKKKAFADDKINVI